MNLSILFIYGLDVLGNVSLFTATIPSLLYFWIVAKDRRGKFFFTFCLVDTITIWVLSITGIVDYFIGNTGLYTFVFRMIAFPVMMLLAWFLVRKPYIQLLKSVAKGWWLFAAMTGLYYVSLTIMIGIPTNLRERPEDMPATIMVLVLLPLTYITIFRVLKQQQELFDSRQRQHTLELQSAAVTSQAKEYRSTENKLRIERHDLRHRLNTIYTMLQNEKPNEAKEYILSAQDILSEARIEHYCSDVILDATIATYFHKAKDLGIEINAQLAIPDELPVPAAELSTVFANALENMINAVMGLPRDKRVIICKCISSPRLMLEFANPCSDNVIIGRNGLPVIDSDSHGIGTRTIKAFSEKYGAVCSFRVEDGWFKLQLAL